jgi:hypothetical protein
VKILHGHYRQYQAKEEERADNGHFWAGRRRM